MTTTLIMTIILLTLTDSFIPNTSIVEIMATINTEGKLSIAPVAIYPLSYVKGALLSAGGITMPKSFKKLTT